MKRPTLFFAQSLALLFVTSSVFTEAPDPIEPREEWFRDLDIEAAVADSELILVSHVDAHVEVSSTDLLGEPHELRDRLKNHAAHERDNRNRHAEDRQQRYDKLLVAGFAQLSVQLVEAETNA